MRMMRNMVKLSTSVTLKELRSPPSSGREKLITSAKTSRILGSINVMKGLRYLILSATWGVWQKEFHSTITTFYSWLKCGQRKSSILNSNSSKIGEVSTSISVVAD